MRSHKIYWNLTRSDICHLSFDTSTGTKDTGSTSTDTSDIVNFLHVSDLDFLMCHIWSGNVCNLRKYFWSAFKLTLRPLLLSLGPVFSSSLLAWLACKCKWAQNWHSSSIWTSCNVSKAQLDWYRSKLFRNFINFGIQRLPLLACLPASVNVFPQLTLLQHLDILQCVKINHKWRQLQSRTYLAFLNFAHSYFILLAFVSWTPKLRLWLIWTKSCLSSRFWQVYHVLDRGFA